MTIDLKISGIRFHIESDIALRIEESVTPFLWNGPAMDTVNVRLLHCMRDAPIPGVPMMGEDLLLEYYLEEDRLICLTKGGSGGYLSVADCDLNGSEIRCYMHHDRAHALNTVGNLLRMIPLRMILQKRDVLFLHASQIGVRGRGILFTAPSGTGKTTQARLWKASRDARILCNDRTLIRNGMTYGFPVDGSEPVFSMDSLPLGAVVVLEQSAENRVRPMKTREALLRLVTQTVHDQWNGESVSAATQQLLELIQQFPVYLLSCTPDDRAVTCLEQQLIKDGIL